MITGVEPWLPSIGALLDRHREAATAASLVLAPEARGSAGYRVPIYGETLRLPKSLRFQQRFPDFANFRAALDDGDPGAIVVALELLARVAAADSVATATQLLELEVVREWRELSRAIAHVLAASHDATAFALLLDNLDRYGFDLELGRCSWPGGCDRAFARLLALVPAWADVELPTWGSGRALTQGPSLDPRARLQASELARYLGKHQYAASASWLERATFHHPDGSFRHACGHALSDYPSAIERMASAIELEERSLLRLGLLAAFRVDPRTVIERLGGFEAAKTDRRTLIALHEVADDARELRLGRGGAGWLTADPRWIDLAVAWTRDREGKQDAAYLFSEAPAELVAAAKAASKPAKKKPKQLSKRELATLRRRLTDFRGQLEGVVDRLRANEYRFVARDPLATLSSAEQQALAQLSAELQPLPPELTLVWELIGVVDLRGSDPSWARHGHVDHEPAGESPRRDPWLTEPLVWLPPSACLEALEDHDGELAIELPISLDAAAAAGQSGCALTLEAPASTHPARLQPGDQTIVELFERALAWGGFPGFASIAERPEAWLARIRSV